MGKKQNNPSAIPTFDMLQTLQNDRFGLSSDCLFNDYAVKQQWGDKASGLVTRDGKGGVCTSAKLANDNAADFKAVFEGGALTPERQKAISDNMRIVTDSVAGGRLSDVASKPAKKK